MPADRPAGQSGLETHFASIRWGGEDLSIEHVWIDAQKHDRPLMVFLHEGLGSVSLWKDFPQQACHAFDCRGLVYARPGYGRSTAPASPALDPDFMHRQANEVLPALLDAIGHHASDQPIWLFGHSDGASIALIYAAHHTDRVAGVIALAPHLYVEQITVSAIARTRHVYLQAGSHLRARLARHHDDADRVFEAWSAIWLRPDFRTWSIDNEVAAITAPLLAVQGIGDEYGTLDQLHRLARCLPQTRLVELPDCGHSPHRDQPAALLAAASAFFAAQKV